MDGDPRLGYALVSLDEGKSAHGRILRVEYDVDKTIEALKATPLPKGLRSDLALGTKRQFLQ